MFVLFCQFYVISLVSPDGQSSNILSINKPTDVDSPSAASPDSLSGYRTWRKRLVLIVHSAPLLRRGLSPEMLGSIPVFVPKVVIELVVTNTISWVDGFLRTIP